MLKLKSGDSNTEFITNFHDTETIFHGDHRISLENLNGKYKLTVELQSNSSPYFKKLDTYTLNNMVGITVKNTNLPEENRIPASVTCKYEK